MPLTFTSLCKAEPRRPHCAWTDHLSSTFSNCKWYTLSELPCRKCSAACSVCIVRSFAFSGLPFVQRGAVHKKQMPFMARGGDCPAAPSRAPGYGVHWSEAETLDGRSGRIGRRVQPGRAVKENLGLKNAIIKLNRETQC